MNGYPRLKIIIADDHNFFRSGFEAVLKSLRYVETITQAENGNKLIDLLEKGHYDLAFVDISMPELNGIEATEIISKRFPKVKIIALSMHDDKENILEMLNKGAKGYILKNTDKAEIDDAIKEVISGNQYFSNEVSGVLYQELKQKSESATRKSDAEALSKERLREVIFLLCHEFGNQEIGEILFLSTRTIESYRKDAIHKIGCKGIVGLIKYGIETGLYKDAGLLEKFKVVLMRNPDE